MIFFFKGHQFSIYFCKKKKIIFPIYRDHRKYIKIYFSIILYKRLYLTYFNDTEIYF